MSSANMTAEDLIILGEIMTVLRNPKVWNSSNYVSNRNELIDRLKRSVFDSASAAARRLAEFTIHEFPSGQITPSDASSLEEIARTIRAVLIHQASLMSLILTDYAPPTAIVDLPTTLGRALEPHQQALQQDIVTCLNAHLARPAIVMAWALGYDLVRAWIFSDANRRQALAATPNDN